MSYHHSSRNNFVSPPTILDRVLAGLPRGLAAYLQSLWQGKYYSYNPALMSSNGYQFHRWWKELRQRLNRQSLNRLLFLPNIFVVIWFLLLLWGESAVFENSIKACDWDNWERWVST
jgi:hypothetical protein